MEINHWSHDHSLVLSEEDYDEIYRCAACVGPMMGLSYCCLECPYVLHKWCAEVPRELTLQDHEIHPADHPLILTPVPLTGSAEHGDSDPIACKLCEIQIYFGMVFACWECRILVHIECAMVPNRLTFEFASDPDSVPIKKDLMFSSKPGEGTVCFLCNGRIQHACFVSGNGKDSIHIQCALLPNRVKHERHINNLTLHAPIEKDLEYDECYCDACEQHRDPNRWLYYCASSEFSAHLGCGVTGSDPPHHRRVLITNSLYALLKSEDPSNVKGSALDFHADIKDRDKMEKEKEETLRVVEGPEELKHFNHGHTLVLYDEPWREELLCDACDMNVFGKTYICYSCDFHLHKHCAQLPKEINHRFHPRCPLTLLASNTFRDCSYCLGKIHNFSYSCEECDFGLHIACTLFPESQMHHSHKHPLTAMLYLPCELDYAELVRLNFPIRPSQVPLCNACQFPCTGLSLSCEKCNFYLHLYCALYPPMGKAETHKHNLVLNCSYEEDPDALEFFCDACEKPRTPNCWVYCCLDPKCYIVAHLDCAVPKLFPTSSSLLGVDEMDGQELKVIPQQ